MTRAIIALLLLSLGSGCTKVVLPYKDEPLCSKGVTGGYCGSLSEVYNAVTAEMDSKKRLRRIQDHRQKEEGSIYDRN